MLFVYCVARSFGFDPSYLVLRYQYQLHPRGRGAPRGAKSRWVRVGPGWPICDTRRWRACTWVWATLFWNWSDHCCEHWGHLFSYVHTYIFYFKTRWGLSPFISALWDRYLILASAYMIYCFHYLLSLPHLTVVINIVKSFKLYLTTNLWS